MFPAKKTGDGTLALVSKYLTEDCITFLHVDERDMALHALVDVLDAQGKLNNKEAFFKAIVEREKIVSTGIGMAVAVPHAKLPGYETFFIALGIHQKGIPWDAIDGVPVRLVFMIGGPDDKQTEYLKLLSNLTFAIKDEERRKKMLQASSTEEIISLFEGL